MHALQRILLPTDFSDCSNVAFQYACELSNHFDAELHLLHVIEHVVPTFPLYGVHTSPPPEMSEWKTSARDQLEKLSGTKNIDHGKVIRALVVGRPSEKILDYSKEQSIDLIIMGTHGRSGLLHLVLGSVAESVLRKSNCPVLTIRPEGRHFVPIEAGTTTE